MVLLAPVAFGLVITIRKTLVPPIRIGLVTKVLVTVGSNKAAVTVKTADPEFGSGHCQMW